MTIAHPDSGVPVRVGKVLCIGRNYARHAAEMNATVPKEPVIFLKPSTALITSGRSIVLPEWSREVHHEVELVALIGRAGKNIAESDALGHVAGYAVGLDMTARDLQSQAKRTGKPWSVAKGFDTFAPLGPIASAASVADPQQLTVQLRVNGVLKQDGRTSDMIFPLAYLVAHLSRIFTLEIGDLLYTGTPDGVGPVHSGDMLEATCTGLPPLAVQVT